MHTNLKIALITGAGSGIGRATALQLGNEGYTCVLAGRRAEALEQTAALLPTPSLIIPTDLRDSRQVEQLVDTTIGHFHRIDAIINNAGWTIAATIAQTNAHLLQEVFAVNAIAPALIIARAWPTLEKLARAETKGGVIVNISSMATIDPFDTLYAYAAAKASVNLLARSVANTGRPLGIRGFSIAPGAVETQLLRKVVDKAHLPTDQTLDPETVAKVVVECVLGRRDSENGGVIQIVPPRSLL